MKKIVCLFSFLFLNLGFSGETDQYSAGGIIIKDSSLIINQFYDQKILEAIDAANQHEDNCSDLTRRLLFKIIKKVTLLVTLSDEIERYPNLSISKKEYLALSIYNKAGFPLRNSKLRRTINVGGVYVGTDKFGHFGLIGRNYYHHYQKHLENGLSKDDALKATIYKGIRQEFAILGFFWNGVFSFADLEANYQGLQFANSICRGTKPYIIKENGTWVKNKHRDFDIRAYFTPKMDEAYNPSFRKPRLWKKIKASLGKIYCPLKYNVIFMERIAQYKERDIVNRNDFYIAEFFKDNSKFNRNDEAVDNLCEQ